jgi:transposase-like protein
MRNGRVVKDKEQYWSRIIEEGRSYPEGISAFCRERGISKNSFYSWFKKLKPKRPDWQEILPKNPPKSNSGTQQAETEVPESPQRRKFKAEYKARILRETDNAPTGEVAAILRREGLYSSNLQKWRAERELDSLSPKKRGPKVNPLAAELKKERARTAKLEKKLRQAHLIIAAQKKIAELLGSSMEEGDDV